MDRFLVTQFDMFRGHLHLFLKSVSESAADQMPRGFNNTIRWNIGHILTIADGCLGLNSLPPNYRELFWKGTSPSDWTEEVPSLNRLDTQLQEQEEQIKEMLIHRLDEHLEQPIFFSDGFQINTLGEAFTFNTVHEGVHLGYMNALRRAIEGNK